MNGNNSDYFDLNGDGDKKDTVKLKIVYDKKKYKSTNGYADSSSFSFPGAGSFICFVGDEILWNTG